VLRIERSHHVARGQCQTLEKIEAALRDGGIHFVEDDSHGPGVHFQGQSPARVDATSGVEGRRQ
jgi:hypothetical protein